MSDGLYKSYEEATASEHANKEIATLVVEQVGPLNYFGDFFPFAPTFDFFLFLCKNISLVFSFCVK